MNIDRDIVAEIKEQGSKKAVPTLGFVNVTDLTHHKFGDVIGQNPHKRDLLIQDSLLNEKNFISYWKSREKHRDPKIDPHQFRYGKIADKDGDDIPEHIAYYNDGTNNVIVGYNQYALGAPMKSQKKAKASYYQKSAKDRQNESYSDFLAENPDKYLKDWMDEETIKKYKEKLEKKLVTQVKSFFKSGAEATFKTLTAKQKTALANAFIKIAAEAMIDNDANRAQVATVKGLKGFVDQKKSFIETIIVDEAMVARVPHIIQQIFSGNASTVEDLLEDTAESLGYYLSAENVTDLFNFATQRQYGRTLSKDFEYNEATHGTGYNRWLEGRYGANSNPLTTRPFTFE